MEQVTIDGVNVYLSHADQGEISWVGQSETMNQLLACWLVLDKKDLPLCPRLVGKPGVGKTTLAMAAAKIRKQPLYIFQCTMDTRPEDLIITPVLGENGTINYHASSLVSAMITGGICILDEGNRMSEKSWASLAPLLDHRRYVESIITGAKITAHPDFRCCVTMNDDASTYELPDYVVSRIQPTIELAFPEREEEMQILKYNIPFVEEDLLQKTVEFLQKSHQQDLDCSTRDGIHILRYALKRLQQQPQTPKEKLWEDAVFSVLGYTPKEADDMAKKKKAQPERQFSDLAEFFMDPDFFQKDPTAKEFFDTNPNKRDEYLGWDDSNEDDNLADEDENLEREEENSGKGDIEDHKNNAEDEDNTEDWKKNE